MKSRRILSIIGLILAAVLLLGIGFAIGRNEVQAAAPDAADDLSSLAHTSDDVLSLDITVTKVDDNDSQSFSPEEIGNNFNQGMSYCGVSDVYIYLNRTSRARIHQRAAGRRPQKRRYHRGGNLFPCPSGRTGRPLSGNF